VPRIGDYEKLSTNYCDKALQLRRLTSLISDESTRLIAGGCVTDFFALTPQVRRPRLELKKYPFAWPQTAADAASVIALGIKQLDAGHRRREICSQV
jgi:hypothetical protein